MLDKVGKETLDGLAAAPLIDYLLTVVCSLSQRLQQSDALLLGSEQRLLTNTRLTEILKMPPDVAADPSRQLPHLASLTADPQALLDKVRALYEQPELSAREEIEFTDGRTIDRVSTPVRDSAGHYYGRL